MKKFLNMLPLIVFLMGCEATTQFLGRSSKTVSQEKVKITNVENKINANKELQLDQVQDRAFGTQTAVNNTVSPEPAIIVAKELNQRVEEIIGLPELARQNAMLELVSNLISNNVQGKVELSQKDQAISALETEESVLLKQKQKELDKSTDMLTSMAAQNDTSQHSLSQYRGWFGLSAVWIGLKQFCTNSFWVLIGIGVIFLILRLLSATNPIASAVFSIFNVFFSWIVNSIKLLAPKALFIANTVEKKVFDATSTTLGKI